MYDFDAQPGTGELSLNSGDILTVTRKDVGEGWWEGTNAKGESGLFPEAYVEVRINRLIIRIRGAMSSASLPAVFLILILLRTMKQTRKGRHLWRLRHFLRIMEASPMLKMI